MIEPDDEIDTNLTIHKWLYNMPSRKVDKQVAVKPDETVVVVLTVEVKTYKFKLIYIKKIYSLCKYDIIV